MTVSTSTPDPPEAELVSVAPDTVIFAAPAVVETAPPVILADGKSMPLPPVAEDTAVSPGMEKLPAPEVAEETSVPAGIEELRVTLGSSQSPVPKEELIAVPPLWVKFAAPLVEEELGVTVMIVVVVVDIVISVVVSKSELDGSTTPSVPVTLAVDPCPGTVNWPPPELVKLAMADVTGMSTPVLPVPLSVAVAPELVNTPVPPIADPSVGEEELDGLSTPEASLTELVTVAKPVEKTAPSLVVVAITVGGMTPLDPVMIDVTVPDIIVVLAPIMYVVTSWDAVVPLPGIGTTIVLGMTFEHDHAVSYTLYQEAEESHSSL